jgi:hypothetical protein
LKTQNFDESPFSQFFGNVYSQNGEDGVIEEILNRIGWSDLSLWAAEFGAWDGRYLSNTFSLVESRKFRAVYIEGDPDKFNDLVLTAAKFPTIVPINAMISNKSGEINSLDNLLMQTEIPKDFDILSIDIDSFDLDIWESLSNYHPKIVVIEINSGTMPGILSRHNKIHDGNSFSSTLQVAFDKNYFLVCHTGNCIFVREDILPLLKIPRRYLDYPELLFRYEPMWMPSDISIFRLLLRRILPAKLKILIMTAISKLRFSLSKDSIPKNN